MSVDVSIIINCYNGEEFLREAIDSVIAQTYRNYEVIFWDNASTDTSVEIAESYRDPRIKIFHSESNVPLGQARQWALNKVSGKYVAFLDVDDFWVPTKVEMQVEVMTSKENCAVCYSNGWVGSREKRDLINPLEARCYEGSAVFPELIKDNFVSWPSVMFNREVCKELRFDPKIKYCEDWEILLRVSLQGSFYYLNEPLVHYRLHDNNLTKQMTDIAYQEQTQLMDDYRDEIMKAGLNITTLLDSIKICALKDYLRRNEHEKARRVANEISGSGKVSYRIIKLMMLFRLHYFLSDAFLEFISRFINLNRFRYY